MAYAQRVSVTVVSDSSGNATAYTSEVLTGRVVNAIYTKTDYANGVDFDITGEYTGVEIWDEDNVNSSAIRAPMQAAHLNDGGTAMLFAAGGTAVPAPIYLANERIKIVIASAGDTKTGTFTFIIA